MKTIVKPLELETAAPFDQLFPIEEQLLAQIVASMKKDGYHKTKPIKVWDNAFAIAGRRVIVDGHTRFAAARRVGIEELPIDARDYDSVTAAYLDAVKEQVVRRNMPRDQIAVFTLKSLQLLKEVGGRSPSKAELAKILGVSTTTVARARAVLKDKKLATLVLDKQMSLFDAYEEVINNGLADTKKPSKNGKPRLPTKAEHQHRMKQLRKREAFELRKGEHPAPEAYEAMLDAIKEAEEGRSSTDFEIDTTIAFDLAFEDLFEARSEN